MTRRQRNLARLNEDRLEQVFQVLVTNCGADAAEEGRFLTDMSHRLGSFSQATPWQFDGYLGAGGFFFGSDGLPAICARLEDMDMETRSMLTGVHRLYGKLADAWRDEDKRARARERGAVKRAAKAAEREARLLQRAPRKRLSALAQ